VPLAHDSGRRLVITTDGVNVYWSDDPGEDGIFCNIMECSVGGCLGGPTMLASEQWAILLRPATLER
jgi:hypothetical protein